MKYLLSFLFGAVVTALFTPCIMVLAKKFNLVDDPKARYHPAHTHTGIIPRAGGAALLLGIILPTLFLIPITKLFIGIFVGATLLVIVGLIDDHHDVNPYIRIITNAIAAGIVVLSGAGIPYITNPLTGGILHLDTIRYTFDMFGPHSILVLADIFAFLWIMWTMNIVGWSAGVDGQMPGFVGVAALTLGILSLRFAFFDPGQSFIALFAFIVSGAFIGFIPWNFYPQKIMPGYGGKTLAGFLLAIIGILSYGKLGTALLVLGIPMVDAVSTLIRRIGKKKSPVLADRGHLHHLLLDAGWGKRKIALFYWGVSAILGAVALIITSQQKFFVFLLLCVGVGALIVWLNFFLQFSKQQDRDNG